MEQLLSGGQRFIFKLLLLDGCHACEQVGYARVAFDFDSAGNFLGTKLLSLVSTDGQSDSFEVASGWIAYYDLDDNIWLISSDGKDSQLVTDQGQPTFNLFEFELNWSPDGRYLAFVRGNYRGQSEGATLLVYDVNNDFLKTLVSGTSIRGFDWAPDSSHLVYGGIWQVNVQSGEVSRLLEPFRDDILGIGAPRWSPDGQHLAFEEFIAGEGSGLFAIYDPQIDRYQPYDVSLGRYSWSPDGNFVVYNSITYVGPGPGLSRLHVSGSVDQITTAPAGGTDQTPVVSPDGQHVAFLRSTGQPPDAPLQLWAVGVDGADLRQVSTLPVNEFLAWYGISWSPDSRNLAVVFNVSGSNSINVIEFATGKAQQLAEGHSPAWQPVTDINHTISGQVTDVNTDEPIVDVTITDSEGRTAVTDDNGNYEFTDLIQGTYTITPTKLGYTFAPFLRETSVPPDANDQNFVGCHDLDEDGLCDSWETFGYDPDGDGPLFLDLPAMGADPSHKDIFVEIDYMEEVICTPTLLGEKCRIHSHRPNPDAIAIVVEAFKNAPVTNPDSVRGIELHVDLGPDTPMTSDENWGNYSRSDPLPHDDEINWEEFYQRKNVPAYFDPARNRIFHYVIFAHRLEPDESDEINCTSGVSSGAPAMDFIVSLAGWGENDTCVEDPEKERNGSLFQQAGTFMHELGHNLGLYHGGNEEVHGKPNYLSVMNYTFQTRGLTYLNNEGGKFDYSRSDRIPPLVETSLDEGVGLNGGSSSAAYGTRWTCPNGDWGSTLSANEPIDWNCTRPNDEENVRTNINQKPLLYSSPPDETLTSYFDWGNLIFLGGGLAEDLTGTSVLTDTVLLNELTLEQDSLIPAPYQVALVGPGGLVVPVGSPATYTFTLANTGDNDDIYTLTATSSLGWADTTSIPSTVSLTSGEMHELAIDIAISPTANVDDVDVLKITVTSIGNPAMWTSLYARTVINPSTISSGESNATTVPDRESEDLGEVTETDTALTEGSTEGAVSIESGADVSDDPVDGLQTANRFPFAIGVLFVLLVVVGGSVLVWRQRRTARDTAAVIAPYICPHCGASNPAHGRFCTKCGQPRKENSKL